MPSDAPIYRAPMRDGAAYALARDLVGIGEPKSERALHRFADLPEGTFVWTRAPDGAYHLGRISGPVRRDDSPAAREAGLVHVRPARWLDRPFGEDELPAAVAATFARGGRNFQRTHSAAAERRTPELWSSVTSR